MRELIRLMRIHHYFKNIIILLPLFFGAKLFEAPLLVRCLTGVFAFGLASSFVYIINDIRDADCDRLHEVKKNRPIASGAVSVRRALVLAVILLASALALNFAVSGKNLTAWIFFCAYIILNILYSFGLKNVILLDIAILVSGFLIRLLYGSAISGISVSRWLSLTVVALSFYMVLGKRRNEIIKQGLSARDVLKSYNKDFLDKNMYMCLALAIMFYSLWCVDPATALRLSNQNIVWTVPLVMFIAMKYSLNIEQNSHGDPVDVILGDKILLALLFVYSGITFFIVYSGRLKSLFGI